MILDDSLLAPDLPVVLREGDDCIVAALRLDHSPYGLRGVVLQAVVEFADQHCASPGLSLHFLIDKQRECFAVLLLLLRLRHHGSQVVVCEESSVEEAQVLDSVGVVVHRDDIVLSEGVPDEDLLLAPQSV